MTFVQSVFVVLAGVVAGAMNAVAGSGTLVTFPALLAVGLPPVLANVSNTVGLLPGSVAGAIGYREHLYGQEKRLLRLSIASFAGAVTGGLLLLRLPASTFVAIVPGLIAVACLLVIVQPLVVRFASVREPGVHPGPIVWVVLFGVAVYGGYFGAAQGIMLIALLGLALDEPLQRVVAAKNVLAGLANATAAMLFIAVTDVAWAPAALIAAGSTLGGFLGARFGRRLPVPVLRGVIVSIGIVAATRLL